jgi:hypothetical protein
MGFFGMLFWIAVVWLVIRALPRGGSTRIRAGVVRQRSLWRQRLRVAQPAGCRSSGLHRRAGDPVERAGRAAGLYRAAAGIEGGKVRESGEARGGLPAEMGPGYAQEGSSNQHPSLRDFTADPSAGPKEKDR